MCYKWILKSFSNIFTIECDILLKLCRSNIVLFQKIQPHDVINLEYITMLFRLFIRNILLPW